MYMHEAGFAFIVSITSALSCATMQPRKRIAFVFFLLVQFSYRYTACQGIDIYIYKREFDFTHREMDGAE